MRLGLGLGIGLELPLPGQRAAHRSPKRAVRSVSAAEAAAGLTLRRSSVLAQEPG